MLIGHALAVGTAVSLDAVAKAEFMEVRVEAGIAGVHD